MMASGSLEEVFVLLSVALSGVLVVQASLVVGERRARSTTSRIVSGRPADGTASTRPS